MSVQYHWIKQLARRKQRQKGMNRYLEKSGPQRMDVNADVSELATHISAARTLVSLL
jgi:hypothetical protein